MLEKAQAAMRYNSLIAGERKTRAKMWKEWWIPASARANVDAEQGNEGESPQQTRTGYHG